jgi:hypothetical protein
MKFSHMYIFKIIIQLVLRTINDDWQGFLKYAKNLKTSFYI